MDTNDKVWCVYMHTNKLNHKVYVGQTCQKPERRWGRNGNGYKSYSNGCKIYFWYAICKYGWGNFEHIVFADNLTKEEADSMEIMLILLYDTTNPKYGYNIASGGNVHVAKGKNNPFYGKHHTDETKQKIRLSLPNQQGENNPFYGKKHSDETKQKLSASHKKVAVVQLSKDGEFIEIHKSIAQAANVTGVYSGNISNCCRHMCKSAGKFIWVYYEEYNKTNVITYKDNSRKPVVQLNKNGEFIAEYASASEAERITGISNNSINRCCNHKGYSAGNYIWEFKENYNPLDNHIYSYSNNIPVVCLDENKNYICEYASISEAHISTGADMSAIIRCCNGKQKTSVGFKWMYKKDLDKLLKEGEVDEKAMECKD